MFRLLSNLIQLGFSIAALVFLWPFITALFGDEIKSAFDAAGLSDQSKPLNIYPGSVPQGGTTTYGKKANNKPTVNYVNPDYTVNYRSISNEFEDNSLRAERKYVGKTVHVQGPVYSIDDDIMGAPYLSISGESDFSMISCRGMSSRALAKLDSFNKGDWITVSGILRESALGLYLKPCMPLGRIASGQRLNTPMTDYEKAARDLENELNSLQVGIQSDLNQLEYELNKISW